MIKVKFLGADSKRAYHGMDEETNTFIHISKGDEIEISEKKKKQLFKDFPDEWEIVKKDKIDLDEKRFSRDGLKSALDELGIDYAKNTSTKKLEELYTSAQKETN